MNGKILYAVSFGNGNDGVSQLYPSYRVWLDSKDSAYDLARLAMIHNFSGNGSSYIAWIKRNMEIDGESDYTITATIYNPIDSPEWSEHNGAWKIAQIFQAENAVSDRSESPIYSCLNACFGAAFVRRHKEKS